MKRYECGASIVRKIALCGDVPYRFTNPVPQAKDGRITRCEIVQKKVRGRDVLLRLSVVEKHDGGKYVMVEKGFENYGSCAEVSVTFQEMKGDEAEHTKEIDVESRKLWARAGKSTSLGTIT